MSKNKKPLIVPTVGRIVWYRPGDDYQYPHIKGEPLAAFITCVHTDFSVNLTIFDINGSHHKRSYVQLVHGDEYLEGRSGTEGYAEWMPYQKGEAAKTEKLGEEFKAELKKELKEEIGAELREGLNEDLEETLEEEAKTDFEDEATTEEVPEGGTGASNPEPQGEAK